MTAFSTPIPGAEQTDLLGRARCPLVNMQATSSGNNFVDPERLPQQVRWSIARSVGMTQVILALEGWGADHGQHLNPLQLLSKGVCAVASSGNLCATSHARINRDMLGWCVAVVERDFAEDVGQHIEVVAEHQHYPALLGVTQKGFEPGEVLPQCSSDEQP